MKIKVIIPLALCLIVIDATAQKRGKAGRKLQRNPQTKVAIGDAVKIGALTDKFNQHKRLTNEGEAYYSKSETKLKAQHKQVYHTIQTAVTEDRIGEIFARDQINLLFTVGNKHRALGNAASTADTSAALTKISKAVQTKMTDRAPAGIITPKVNRIQFQVDEIIRFGSESGTLSDGELNTIRRKLYALDAKEDKAKAGGNLSDRDHENLLKDCRDLWKDLLEKF